MSNESERPKGIYKVADYLKKLKHVWKHGRDAGLSTGIYLLDSFFRLVLGKLVIVTGIPSSGKSELVDMLIINTAHMYDWKWAVFSPENHPLDEHHIKLAEKYIGKPWKDTYSRKGFTQADFHSSADFIEKHISFIYPPEDELSLDGILSIIEWLAENEGLNGMVIDPWNEIEHKIPAGMNESNYIAWALGKIRRFARKHNIICFVIAHPTKLEKDKSTGLYPPPTPYNISGSANWRNKADYCLCVHRDDPNATDTSVFVQKVKFKGTGRCGALTLYYDYFCGRYSDVNGNFVLPDKCYEPQQGFEFGTDDSEECFDIEDGTETADDDGPIERKSNSQTIQGKHGTFFIPALPPDGNTYAGKGA